MSKRIPYVDIRGYHEGVTGSCIRNTVHFAYGGTYRFLVDYGMYQGEGHNRGLDYNDSVNPEKISAVLLTHPHLDHDGALPIFVKKGYNKKIYMSDAAACVIDIGFRDSYNIMKKDAKLLKKPPLYSETDIERTLSLIEPVRFEQPVRIHDFITVTFFNNGHLIGASVILVQIHEPGQEPINLLYTGDYKHDNVFLDIKPLPFWVYALPNLTIICESTYGTTNSWDIKHTWEEDIIDACSQNRTIVNTAFAQGRFQELMYFIRKLQDEGEIPKDYPVRVDGKTGIDYTFRYISHSNIIKFKEGMDNFFPYNLQFVDEKSRPSVMNYTGGQIIITTSGMGSNGPAREYIPHYLSKSNALIYFPGYTSEETIGRRIIEAEYGQTVVIKNQEIMKRAQVLQTLQFLAHDPADWLIAFLNMFAPRSILFNHGAPEIKDSIESRAKRETGVTKTGILGMGYVYRITSYGIDKAIQK